MWLREITARYFLLVQLLIFTRASSMEVPETTSGNSFDQVYPDQFSARVGTTTSSLEPVTGGNRKSTLPVVLEDPPRNGTNVFRPSVHLGEIVQPASRTSPFNNAQHVKFESDVQLDTRRERFQETLRDAYQSVSGVVDEATRPSRIKFQDDVVVRQTSSVHRPYDDQRTVTDGSESPYEEADLKHVYVDQTFFQNMAKPEAQDATTTGRSTTGHRSPTDTYYDNPRFPYVVGYYTANGQNAYQHPMPVQETAYEITKRPEESGLLVVQQHESTYTRKRKFPYQFYQPSDGYHDVEFVEEPQSAAAYPQTRKLSPWKRIIRLIGTFLPLGLLLATLTPKVVRIDNATSQPNIVLSKLRAVDLPVEHKRARLLDDRSAVCEDRSICELILAGGEPGSNILQNILWNLAIRISDDVARRNGLREVFSAVRRKDCMTISC